VFEEPSGAYPHDYDYDAAPDFRPLSLRFDEALLYASWAHREQARKQTATPYLSHLLGVASMVMEYEGTEDQAIAALLHDTVEDCGQDHIYPIRERFGDNVARIVVGCSDAVVPAGWRGPPWAERKLAYLERLRSLPAEDPILLVSACDKLHNARSIVRDLRVHGPWMWYRFSRPASHQLWYYRTMAETFLAVMPGVLADDVARAVADMERLAGS
jgi:(p)ppGpp synthase/HD superfamily hydrolase